MKTVYIVANDEDMAMEFMEFEEYWYSNKRSAVMGAEQMNANEGPGHKVFEAQIIIKEIS